MKTNKKAFAISVDALLATMLALGVLTFAGIGLQVSDEDNSPLVVNIKQLADDTFLALDNTGIISKELVDQSSDNPASSIRQEAEKMLPSNIELRVEVSEFEPIDIKKCRETQTFEDCFGDSEIVMKGCEGSFNCCSERDDYSKRCRSGKNFPIDREVIHGRKLAITRSMGTEQGAQADCVVVEEELKGKETGNPMAFEKEESKEGPMSFENGEGKETLASFEKEEGEENPMAFEKEESRVIRFDEPLEKSLSTEILVTNPAGELYETISCCDDPSNPQEDETVMVTMKLRDSSRDPVAVVLAMDESGSMDTYDVLKHEATTSFNDGTCADGECSLGTNNCPTNNTEYTGWEELYSFTADEDFLNAFPPEYPDQELRFRVDNSIDTSETCSRIAKLKLVAPDGTVIYYSSYPYFVVYPDIGDFEAHNTGDKIWRLYGWSNISRNYNVYQYFWSTQHAKNISPSLGGGTGTGSGDECVPNTSTFQKIGDITLPTLAPGLTYYAIYAYMYWPTGTYDESVSGCYPRLYFKKSDGSDVSSTEVCDYYSYSCSLFETYSSPQPSGTYEVWAWSDQNLSLTDVRFSYYVYLDPYYVYQGTIDTSADGCKDTNCTITPTNCTTKTDWFDSNHGGGNDVDTYTVESGENLKGLRTKVWSSGYDGVCDSGTGISSTYYSPNYRIRFPDNSVRTSYLTGDYCYDGYCETAFTKNPHIDEGTYELEGWADDETDVTVKWYMRRLDAARNAAKDFINREDWKTEDRFGLVPYDDTVDPMDIVYLTNDKDEVLDELDALSPGDGTATAEAIKKATGVLEDAETDSKFLILLTDGRANYCTSSFPFSKCANTSSCCEGQAIADAIVAANTARAEGITVYVIGFADSSLIGDYEDELKELALDKDDPRYSDDCDSGAKEFCGKYYFAADEEQLEEMYEKIVGEIGQRFGNVEIEVPLPDGMELLEDESMVFGVWSDEENDFWSGQSAQDHGELEWDPVNEVITLPGERSIYYVLDKWFAMQFQVVLPCSGSFCYTNAVVFPPNRGSNDVVEVIDQDDGTKTEWAEGAKEYCTPDDWPTACSFVECPEDYACRDKYLELPYLYKDLAITFTDGRIDAGKTYINLNVANVGYKDITLDAGKMLQIEFENDAGPIDVECESGDGCTVKGNGNIDTLEGVKIEIQNGNLTRLYDVTLCEPESGTCIYHPSAPAVDTEMNLVNLLLSQSGEIVATINSNGAISECSRNNTAHIYCGDATFRFFVIDYYAWVK